MRPGDYPMHKSFPNLSFFSGLSTINENMKSPRNNIPPGIMNEVKNVLIPSILVIQYISFMTVKYSLRETFSLLL